MGSQVIGRGLGKENNIGRGPGNELGGGTYGTIVSRWVV